jgi:hypothetical protein
VLTAGRPEQLVDLQGGPDEVDDHQVCQARPGGGLAQVSVKNPERRALGRWNVEWSFAGDERITYLWGGDVHQDGASVTVGNGRFNGRVKPGAPHHVRLPRDHTVERAAGRRPLGRRSALRRRRVSPHRPAGPE